MVLHFVPKKADDVSSSMLRREMLLSQCGHLAIMFHHLSQIKKGRGKPFSHSSKVSVLPFPSFPALYISYFLLLFQCFFGVMEA